MVLLATRPECVIEDQRIGPASLKGVDEQFGSIVLFRRDFALTLDDLVRQPALLAFVGQH